MSALIVASGFKVKVGSPCGEKNGIYGSGDTPSLNPLASPTKSGYVWFPAAKSVGGRMRVASSVNF